MIKAKPKANPRTKPKQNSKSISKRGGGVKIYPEDGKNSNNSKSSSKPKSKKINTVSSFFRAITGTKTGKVAIEPLEPREPHEQRPIGGAKRKRGGVFPFSKIFRSKKVAPSDLPSQRRRTPSPQRRRTPSPQRRQTTPPQPPQPPHKLTMTGNIFEKSNRVAPIPKSRGPQRTGRVLFTR